MSGPATASPIRETLVVGQLPTAAEAGHDDVALALGWTVPGAANAQVLTLEV